MSPATTSVIPVSDTSLPAGTATRPQKLLDKLVGIPPLHKPTATDATKKTSVLAQTSHPVTVPSMQHTLAWLHSRDLSHKKVSCSFIQSLLHCFHTQQQNATPPLPLGWGSTNLTLSWAHRSFGVLNAPIYADIAVAKRILAPGGWFATIATRSQRLEFATWVTEFLGAVRTCDGLKHELLAEKAQLSSHAADVTTTYDRVRSIYDSARQLSRQHDVAVYGAKLLQCLDEVETLLRDEERVVGDVNSAASTETLENVAFSMLFGRLGTQIRPLTDDHHGVYMAMLMAWMRSQLSREEFDAFFHLLQPQDLHDPNTCPACGDWLKDHKDVSSDQLDPSIVHVELEKLRSMNHQVEAHDKASRKKTTKGVASTIAWLQQHQEEKKASSGFIHSLLHWFRHDDDDKVSHSPLLPVEWAQSRVDVDWTERSYAVLNAPFYADMSHARRIFLEGTLRAATDDVAADFKTWIAEFMAQLGQCRELKDELLEEKADVANKAIRVRTEYDEVQRLYEATVDLDPKTPEYEASVVALFEEVEATLVDEAAAVAEANPLVMNPDSENEAFSNLFAGMEATDDKHGVVIAKIVAWMKNNLPRADFDAFMALFDNQVQHQLGGPWMQLYAQHLHRLEPFAIEFHCAFVYGRSRADVVAPLHDPTQP
ncbi:hypothetical protein DYB32_003431 [Aphanomyces invadans]|uniref:Uncharacterized protein n=1 Tax=Aphanomyces invadans TaxID=157072 RepID=A0A418B0N7_9STRA|nr:hypothetical protein DYB32_003431 [Aphanomyces invadans]